MIIDILYKLTTAVKPCPCHESKLWGRLKSEAWRIGNLISIDPNLENEGTALPFRSARNKSLHPHFARPEVKSETSLSSQPCSPSTNILASPLNTSFGPLCAGGITPAITGTHTSAPGTFQPRYTTKTGADRWWSIRQYRLSAETLLSRTADWLAALNQIQMQSQRNFAPGTRCKAGARSGASEAARRLDRGESGRERRPCLFASCLVIDGLNILEIRHSAMLAICRKKPSKELV